MPKIKTYHRPDTVEEALTLLAEPGAVPLAGGTQLVAAGEAHPLVVDLQGLGLNEIEQQDGALTAGATARIQALVDHPGVPDLVRDAARREGPNTFRNAGTVGGVVTLADPQSELFAALLVHDAAVTIRRAGGERREVPLSVFAPRHGELMTAVAFQAGGRGAAERVARTPADDPIVAAVARVGNDGEVRLALCGVANRPVLLSPADLDTLTPPDDFRGSAPYRREMAALLTRRVLAALEEK